MDMRFLAPLFALAIAIGWFFPSSESAPTGTFEHAAKATKPGLSASPEPQPEQDEDYGSYDPVTIDRTPDGHFYTTADVGGTPVRFLIDTGATMIALTGDDARALGFGWSDSELIHVGRGVNGDVMGKPVILDSVAVGDVEFSNLQAVIIPNGLDISLLGQSFLGKIDNVKIERDRMTLGES